MTAYVPVLRRYWWVLAIGVVVAVVGALASVYRLPSTDLRSEKEYTATARLLVTGANAAYFRTAVPEVSELQRDGAAASPNGTNTTVRSSRTPDISAYVRAANLYPILIESDQVQAFREKLFGPTDGWVTANAMYQVATPGRFRLSEIPVVQVFGTSGTAEDAITIAQNTAVTFMKWITQQQKKAGIPAETRILVREIQQPTEAIPSGGTSLALPVMIFAGILLAFGALAILIDRVRTSMAGGVVAEPDEAAPKPVLEEVGGRTTRRGTAAEVRRRTTRPARGERPTGEPAPTTRRQEPPASGAVSESSR